MQHIKAFEESQKLYEVNQLPYPPIPKESIEQLVKISDWIFGTRQNSPSPYLTHFYWEELQTNTQLDYLLFGHAGHGIMSYALHFYYVKDSLALFLQHSWGNADSNAAKDIEKIKKDYQLAAQLIELMREKPKETFQTKLVIHQSTLKLYSRWALCPAQQEQFVWQKTPIGLALETTLDLVKNW